MSGPFSQADVQEWMACGSALKVAKGEKPTQEQLAASKVTKEKRHAMSQRLSEKLKGEWVAKKVEKELDKLAEATSKAAAETAKAIPRPAYLDGPSGTRDFYPEDMRVQNWLFGHMKETARLFGFKEYDAPVLEHVQLYERKAGEEIVDQMYAFTDKEGDRVTLRPEMTPSLARLVLNRTNLQTGEVQYEGGLPLKWFSIPQCWRFETTQRGRKREHYQWNMDIVGVPHVNAEVELLAAACDFFKRIGIGADAVGIKVNSRAVLETLLAKYGIKKVAGGEDTFAKVCVIIDKLDKIGDDAVVCLLGEAGVGSTTAFEILAALKAESVDKLAELVGGESDAIKEVKTLFAVAAEYGFADYLIFDAAVVRGLAYYTGVVWEAFDRRGELRAIMGGGRYDRLLELYGGEKCTIPCCGFGFGDCVIMELLKELSIYPECAERVDFVVSAWSLDLYGKAANIAARLRMLGYSVDLMPSPKRKVAAAFEHADRAGARRMVFVAPDELEKGCVRVKDMHVKDSTGEAVQIDCPLDALETIDAMIDAASKA